MKSNFLKSNLIPMVFVAVVVILIWRITHENNNNYIKNTNEYTEQETLFYNTLRKDLENNMNHTKPNPDIPNYQIKTAGMTISNFEGPQVHIYGFMYGDSTYLLEDYIKNPVKEFSIFKINKLKFDPDQATYNIPDIDVSIEEQPRIFKKKSGQKGEEAAIASLQNGNFDSPYMTISKKYYRAERDSSISSGNMNIDIWLTQFTVNVKCTPYRGKNSNKKPYNARKETDAYRHGKFKLLLRLIPNYAPWYTSDRGSFDEKADIAVGGVYCSKIKMKHKLGNKVNCEINREGYNLPLEGNSDLSFSEESLLAFNRNSNIWNTPDTVSLYFDNFGTYSVGKPDNVTYTFIMPILVKGKWEVKLPSKFFTDIVNKQRNLFSREFSFLPDWGFSFGKIITWILYILIGGILIKTLFPTIIQIIAKLIFK
jgi:hypothetical protein